MSFEDGWAAINLVMPRRCSLMAASGLPPVFQKHNLLLIEDGSQSHGALWKGRKVGRFGDSAGFSCIEFNFNYLAVEPRRMQAFADCVLKVEENLGALRERENR